jgi:hypothetical protein
MTRYEIRLKGKRGGIRPGKWRLIERKGGGETGYKVVMEGDGDYIRLPGMNYGPFRLSNVSMDFAEQVIVFHKPSEDRQLFRETGHTFMSSYVMEFGEDGFGFFVDGSRRPRKKSRERKSPGE